MIRFFLLVSASIIVFEIKAQILTSEVKVEQTGNITSIQGQVGIGTAAPFQKLSIQDGQLYFGHSKTNEFESGRLRFSEFTSDHYQGAFIHYDGSNNVFNIGVHNEEGTSIANDKNAISIARSTGNVGFGTMSPFQKLSIHDGQLYFGHSTTNQFESGRLRFSEYATGSYQGAFIHYDGSSNLLHIGVHEAGDSSNASDVNAISVRRSNGHVGIGVAPSNNKLEVNGTVRALTFSAVSPPIWPDYVFSAKYKMRTLEEVEDYIFENKHLPEVPSETEVIENGINLGEMDAKLLQKIEELTLYMIEMNKRMNKLETENTELQEKVESLEK